MSTKTKSRAAAKSEVKETVYDRVTAKIVEMMEAGVRPWSKPWTTPTDGGCGMVLPRRENGEHYRGMNVLILWMAAEAKGYTSPFWMTFKQAQAYEGACVRKGEKGTEIVYANTFQKDTGETNEAGEAIKQTIPFLKAYHVFNASQIEGLPAEFYAVETPTPIAPENVKERNAAVEAFVKATGADVRETSEPRAYYSRAPFDFINMPRLDWFADSESFYSTELHELIHWTGDLKRLNREKGAKFGDVAYAKEELIAEIGAAFLCCTLNVSPVPREDHAAYLQSWIQVLKADHRAIFTAASAAQKAAEFLQAFSA
jgi:antirestriction protein ArdC